MSDRSVSLLLTDIRTAIECILEYTEGMRFEQYVSDIKTRHAVERNFEIIGEAAARIPKEYRVRESLVEWRILKDFRNFIIHEYFGVDDQIVWDTVQFRLGDLLAKVQELLVKDNRND